MSTGKLEQIKEYRNLPENHREWLLFLAGKHRLSLQQLRFLLEYSLDMVCWDEGSLKRFYHPEAIEKQKGKQAAAKIFQQLKDGYHGLKNSMKPYPENGHVAAEEKGTAPLEERIVTRSPHGRYVRSC